MCHWYLNMTQAKYFYLPFLLGLMSPSSWLQILIRSYIERLVPQICVFRILMNENSLKISKARHIRVKKSLAANLHTNCGNQWSPSTSLIQHPHYPLSLACRECWALYPIRKISLEIHEPFRILASHDSQFMFDSSNLKLLNI